jgi:hypothetical protein
VFSFGSPIYNYAENSFRLNNRTDLFKVTLLAPEYELAYPVLNSCIIKSLQSGQMHPELPAALLTPHRNKVRNRSETPYWDYKRELALQDPFQTAEFAKDVLAFHNTNGGLIAVGVTNDYAVSGVSSQSVFDLKHLRDKITPFIGADVGIFQDSIPVPGNKFIWLIFIRKYIGVPQSMQCDGPYRFNKPTFSKGSYFYRDGDEVKLCRSEGDIERIFRGFSNEHLSAYTYEIDMPYFRLLNPNCERFVGRKEKITEIKDKLKKLRQPVIALDGLGGVGKTAIAIQAVRELYDDNRYLFIVSLSAKSKVWLGHVKPRAASFAGLHGLLSEIAAVFRDIPLTEDTVALKKSIIDFMAGTPGLLLIDNLEEINDEGIFQFLREEIPEPVKVLVTSRVVKDVGAVTISVPAMSPRESDNLLRMELERLGFPVDENYEGDLKEILSASGGVPLAIKWAAQIASENESLRVASSILRDASAKKQELLNFCCTTMYDALSDTAKDAAKLIPDLGSDWNAITLSIALNIPIETVRLAIYELADKGIIFRSGDKRTDDYGVLPLTRDYLSGKWNESHALRRKVEDQFTQMFSSDKSDGFLLDWDVKRRVDFLTRQARTKIASGEYDAARKLVQLAQNWSQDAGLSDSAIKLRFLEGQILYTSGSNKLAGIVHMRQAIEHDNNDSNLEGAEILLFAEALFAHGDRTAEKEASAMVLTGLQRGGVLTEMLLDRFIGSCLTRNDSRLIATIISKIKDGHLLCIAFDRIELLLNDRTVAYSHRDAWADGIKRLLGDPLVDGTKKRQYREKWGPML